jgi:hypothetical protein
VFPAEASSMSLTCQLPPEPATVTAYCPLLRLTPPVLVIFWRMTTMNVMLPEPNARSELMLEVPVETCFARTRGPATPGVA